MMIRSFSGVAFMSLAAVALASTPARAQFVPPDPSGSGVMTSGTETIERQPDILRVQVMIAAEGKDAKEAIAKLKEKETAARSKVAQLGAAEASVSFSDAAAQEENQQQQMERMIRSRNGRAPKPTKTAPAVKLFTMLKAEWPLKAKTGDDLLIESHDIQDKIKSADLSADKESASTPEQEEAAEEQQGMGDNQPNPKDPVFLFVSKLTEQDREKAEAAAFKKAAKAAEGLARAGGGQLGAVRLITSQAAPSLLAGGFRNQLFDGGYRQQMIYNMLNGGDEENAPLEAIGTQPGKVSYRVTVSVSFALKG